MNFSSNRVFPLVGLEKCVTTKDEKNQKERSNAGQKLLIMKDNVQGQINIQVRMGLSKTMWAGADPA